MIGFLAFCFFGLWICLIGMFGFLFFWDVWIFESLVFWFFGFVESLDLWFFGFLDFWDLSLHRCSPQDHQVSVPARRNH